MAGKKGQSGPPGNANAFRHGLAAVQRRRVDGELTEEEQEELIFWRDWLP
jgi:hypothetical protein